MHSHIARCINEIAMARPLLEEPHTTRLEVGVHMAENIDPHNIWTGGIHQPLGLTLQVGGVQPYLAHSQNECHHVQAL